MNRVVDLSIETPIDVAKAIVLLGNQTKIFNQMLGKLEVLSLNPSLEALAQAVEDRDFPKMKSKAHSLKGASGYIGASCLHYSCYHIQDQFMAGNFERMLDYYPLLIECSIDFKIESRKILAAHNGKSHRGGLHVLCGLCACFC